MKKIITLLLVWLLPVMALRAAVTIDELVAKAEANYPLIRQYGLMDATLDVDLSDINHGWLPRIGLYGQATVQNVVPAFPAALTGVLQQMGHEVKGISKLQYKAGVDVSQTVWDGGASAARREVTRAQNAARRAALDVELYAVRQRVENLYFAVLLTHVQIEQTETTCGLLGANLERLQAMLTNGTAMQADVDMVEAQLLSVRRSLIEARSAVSAYRRALELLTDTELAGQELTIPDGTMPGITDSARPELRLFDTQLTANSAARRLTDTSLIPKIGLFAQAYYGYPGIDYFKSMMSRDLTFNLLAGLKVSWNIDSFYTRGTTRRRTALNEAEITSNRDVFLLNNRVQAESERHTIAGLQEAMKDDVRIVSLRESVRRAAEAQLENGIIDATALLSKITDESAARLTEKFHQIQLLQEIYKLKYTLNR